MNLHHLSQALHRQGIAVHYEDSIYSLRSAEAEVRILLPAGLPLPARAVKQLLAFAKVCTAQGEPTVHCTCAMPDFHPGELAPVGSIVATEPDFVIPQSIGTDINCGMRLIGTGLPLERFQAISSRLIKRLTASLLVGARDIPVPGRAFQALFDDGPEAFIEGLHVSGLWAEADRARLLKEISACVGLKGLRGASRYAPDSLCDQARVLIRDPQFGTVGSGNHFVEFAVCEELQQRTRTWREGLTRGEVVAMIHSGSRAVGQYVGKRWMAEARAAWPKGLAHPESGLYGLSGEAARSYLEAMGAAARYAWANRVALAELVRAALREATGTEASRLIVDVPHNVVLEEDGLNVHRKGSTPAHLGQLALIPGSMGSSSYLVEGLGHPEWLASCSHGAGRAVRRQRMRRTGARPGRGPGQCITLREARAIEEAPHAYKPIDEVVSAQCAAGLIRPVARFSPLVTFKA